MPLTPRRSCTVIINEYLPVEAECTHRSLPSTRSHPSARTW
jgi:hypothetical protein